MVEASGARLRTARKVHRAAQTSARHMAEGRDVHGVKRVPRIVSLLKIKLVIFSRGLVKDLQEAS